MRTRDEAQPAREATGHPLGSRPSKAVRAWLLMAGIVAGFAMVGCSLLFPPSFTGRWKSTHIEGTVASGSAQTWTFVTMGGLFDAALSGSGGSATLGFEKTGRYQETFVGQDHGSVSAIGSALQFSSAVGNATARAEFTTGSNLGSQLQTIGGRQGDDLLMLQEPGGKWQLDWVGTPARPPSGSGIAGRLPAGVAGDWRNSFISTPVPGQVWSGELHIGADGTYRLRISREASGLWQAAKGTVTLAGSGATPPPGSAGAQESYQFHGRDHVTTTSGDGWVDWERID